MESVFTKSYNRFLCSEGKMTMVYPEEVCSNFSLSDEELNIFLTKGGTDINKTEKTELEIKEDERQQLGQ